MPITRRTITEGGVAYATLGLWIGPMDHPDQLLIDVSALTTDEVDAKGYLKPGVPFAADGTPVGAGEAVHGVNLEPVRVAESNTDLASITADVWATVGTRGNLNRAAAEDVLGRAYTAAEVAGFALAGSQIKLID